MSCVGQHKDKHRLGSTRSASKRVYVGQRWPVLGFVCIERVVGDQNRSVLERGRAGEVRPVHGPGPGVGPGVAT